MVPEQRQSTTQKARQANTALEAKLYTSRTAHFKELTGPALFAKLLGVAPLESPESPSPY